MLWWYELIHITTLHHSPKALQPHDTSNVRLPGKDVLYIFPEIWRAAPSVVHPKNEGWNAILFFNQQVARCVQKQTQFVLDKVTKCLMEEREVEGKTAALIDDWKKQIIICEPVPLKHIPSLKKWIKRLSPFLRFLLFVGPQQLGCPESILVFRYVCHWQCQV